MGGEVTERSAKGDNGPGIEHGEQDADCHTRCVAREQSRLGYEDGDAIDSDSGIVILSEGLAFDGWDELWVGFWEPRRVELALGLLVRTGQPWMSLDSFRDFGVACRVAEKG
jgi:hypothetical protein